MEMNGISVIILQPSDLWDDSGMRCCEKTAGFTEAVKKKNPINKQINFMHLNGKTLPKSCSIPELHS